MARIYCLTHPTSSRLYIGKTAKTLDERLNGHRWQTKASTKKNNWIKSLRNEGLSPNISLIAEVDDSKWEEAEKFYIKLGWQVAPDDMLNDSSAMGGRGSNFDHQGGKIGRKNHIPKRYKKNCPVCKNEFITKRNKIVYCSKRCVSKFLYDSKREKLKILNTKLSPSDVKDIVVRINNGEYIKDISMDYGVSNRAISDNLNGKRKSGVRVNHKRIVTAAKLTESQVEEIKLEYASGNVSQKELGSKFGVDQSTVNDIVSGKSWKSTN